MKTLDEKLFPENLRNFLIELERLVRDKPLERWKEACEQVMDFGCFVDPSFWHAHVDDIEYIRDIVDHCIKIRELFKRWRMRK